MAKKVPFVIFIISHLLLLGCGRQDVSSNPANHFAAIAGTMCKTKVPLVILQSGRDYVGSICTAGYEDDFLHGKVDTSSYGAYGANVKVITVLPIGTIIRIDQLMTRGGDIGGHFVTFSVQSGKYSGTKSIEMPDSMFLPNSFIDPVQSKSTDWLIDQGKLEKYVIK